MTEVGHLFRRPRQLASEARLCFSRGASWTDRWHLGCDTTRFHVANYLQRSPRLQPINRYRIRVASRVIDLNLRPFAGDFFVLHEVFAGGFYDIPAPWRKRVRTIVDLGAHVGMAALYLLEALPHSRVVCVEPAPDNVALLVQNLRPFGDRAMAVEAAIAGTPGSGVLERRGWSWGRRLEGGAASGHAVRCLTVDAVMREAGLDSIDLLKIDVEGAEDAILRDSPDWLNVVGCIIIEIHAPYSLEQFRRDMRRVGMQVIDADSQHGNRMTMAVKQEWLANS